MTLILSFMKKNNYRWFIITSYYFLFSFSTINAQPIKGDLIGHWALNKIEIQEKVNGVITTQEVDKNNLNELTDCYGLGVMDINFYPDEQHFNATLLSGVQIKDASYVIITFVDREDFLLEVALKIKQDEQDGQQLEKSFIPAIRYNVKIENELLKITYVSGCDVKQSITMILKKQE